MTLKSVTYKWLRAGGCVKKGGGGWGQCSNLFALGLLVLLFDVYHVA
jgi:hypothetical protein